MIIISGLGGGSNPWVARIRLSADCAQFGTLSGRYALRECHRGAELAQRWHPETAVLLASGWQLLRPYNCAHLATWVGKYVPKSRVSFVPI